MGYEIKNYKEGLADFFKKTSKSYHEAAKNIDGKVRILSTVASSFNYETIQKAFHTGSKQVSDSKKYTIIQLYGAGGVCTDKPQFKSIFHF